MTFQQVVMHCYERKDLVEQFDRLSGTTLMSKGVSFEIDIATGKFADDALLFIEFVKEFVWLPLIGETLD